MAKRTRRDLSNPRIKRIVKSQSVSGKSKTNRQSQRRRKSSGGRVVLFLLVILGGIFILVYPDWANLSLLFKRSQGNVPPGSTEQLANSNRSAPDLSSSAAAVPGDSAETGSEVPTVLQPPPRKIQVEVLNGCGVNGLAEKVTRYLRAKNIDVVSRGNYDNFEVINTKILDRIGNPERVKNVAEALGVSAGNVMIKKDENLQLDATIVLGADYKNLPPFTNPRGQ